MRLTAMRPRFGWQTQFVLLSVIWGSSFLFIKVDQLIGHLACAGAAVSYGIGFNYTRRNLAGRVRAESCSPPAG